MRIEDIKIHPFMTQKLGLKGNSLLIYALIFAQSEHAISATLYEVAELLNIDDCTVKIIYNQLCERGILVKESLKGMCAGRGNRKKYTAQLPEGEVYDILFSDDYIGG